MGSEIKPDWRIVKLDWTKECGEGWTSSNRVRSAVLFYLTDINRHVHLCELTPSLELWPMLGQIEFNEGVPETETNNELRADLEDELLASEETCIYIHVSDLARHEQKPLHFDLTEAADREADEDDDAFYMRCIDVAREELHANQHWPF